MYLCCTGVVCSACALRFGEWSAGWLWCGGFVVLFLRTDTNHTFKVVDTRECTQYSRRSRAIARTREKGAFEDQSQMPRMAEYKHDQYISIDILYMYK